jgi:prepilin-type N-terminal cleavage/methylation domain-containing protein
VRVNSQRAFTLIELLVVIGILAILASLLMPALSKVKTNADIAAAKSNISSLKTALANYKSDTGRYPRGALRPNGASTPGDGAWYQDDCIALYAALSNKPTLEVGGGPNGPYVEGWKPQYVGVFTGLTSTSSATAPDAMGSDGSQYVEAVPAKDHDRIYTLDYQKSHAPNDPTALVFLDPWGNPYHYREWSSLRGSFKDALINAPVSRTCTQPAEVSGSFVAAPTDSPHNVSGYDVWSNGPNGINEYGHPDSDDVTSWRE